MVNRITVSECPTCGSAGIKKVKRDCQREVHGQAYVVPALEYWECPDCGEGVYEASAMRKIEEYSPAYASRQRKSKAA